MSASFWNGKRVLITGDTGFKGAWLSYILNNHGSTVQGVSSSEFNQNTNLYSSLELNKITNTIDCDIRNIDEIKRIFKSFNPDIVFHLAAQPLVRHSYKDPLLTYETNVIGTLIILEAIKETSSVQAAVMVTTDKCYENHEWEWGYRENDPLGGHDPYSSSKACAELLISSYQQSFFNNAKSSPGISSVRAGNVIGGGDWAKDRIVVDCMKAWNEKRTLEIRSPNATRPWQHVLEPLSGYLIFGQELNNSDKLNGEGFNFGPRAEQNHTVDDLLLDLSKYWNFQNINDAYKVMEQIPFHEAGLLKLNCDKALFYLNWGSNLTYSDNIKFTSEWYYDYYRKKINMYDKTIQQIAEYESLAQDKNLQWTE